MSLSHTSTLRRIALAAVAAAALFLPQATWAHHGWGWATDEEFELTGTIVTVRLGNPHGELTLQSGAERWVVEVGQPWRNANAGLSDTLLAEGTVLTVHGHRSAKAGERLIKAERLVIAGRSYDLYPDRES
jgi:hypothetical protein